MKKVRVILVGFICICLLDICSGQDFLNINISGSQSDEVIPKNVVTNEGNRYLLYDKVNSSNINYPIIGLTKINSSNQIQYDIQVDLSNNTTLFYGNELHAADVEVFENTVFVLASVSSSRFLLLLSIDKNTGSLLRKEQIDVSYSTLTYHSETIPVDLYIGRSDDPADPYICILSENRADNDGQVILLYRKLSQSTYEGIGFGSPYPSLYRQSAIMEFEKGNNLSNRVNVMAVNDRESIVVFSYEFNTGIFRPYFSLLATFGSNFISVAKHFFYDGTYVFYGQLVDLNHPSNFGPLFTMYGMGSTAQTYNCPGFQLVAGEAHPNDYDFTAAVGFGHTSTYYTAFSGLRYNTTDPTHPHYVVGYLDYDNGHVWGPYGYSYMLRNSGSPNPSSLPEKFGAATFSGTLNQITSFLYRKPTSASDRNNGYYLHDLNGSSSCNNTLTFTSGAPLSVYNPTPTSDWRITQARLSSNFYVTDIVINYNLVTIGNLSGVCNEPLTDSYDPPPVEYWDPECNCFHLPPNINAKKNSVTSAIITSEAIDLAISPNPVSDQLTIRAGSPIRHIEIFDGAGRSILRKSSEQNLVIIPVGQLAAGAYIVKVSLADGKSRNQKIIKLQK